jgi:hypothetical protein
LLRVLFLRLGQVPTDSGRRELLCVMSVRPNLEPERGGERPLCRSFVG